MHTILHKLANGGVGNYPPNPAVLAVMVGPGTGWAPERIAWEIAKFIEPVPDHITGKFTFSVDFAVEWCLALAAGGLTEAEALDLFARRIQLRRGYTENLVVDDATLPYHIKGNGNPRHGACADPNCHDRYFRDACRYSPTKGVVLDLPAARAIHLATIRQVRDAELAKLDILYMKALEAPDPDAIGAEQYFRMKEIADLKQALRDIPQTFDLTKYRTPATLKAAWPSELLPSEGQ